MFLLFISFIILQEDCFSPIYPSFGLDTMECYNNNNYCCNSLFNNIISNNLNNSLINSISTFISYPMASCRSNIEYILCDLCYIGQNQYILYNETSNLYSIILCESYCNLLYNSCSGQTNSNGLSIYNQFNTSYDFCFSLFNSSYTNIYIRNNTYDCINNIPKCTENNYYSNYTKCINGQRSLLWYQTNELCNGGLFIPNNSYNLPCGNICGPGLYFNNNTNNCDYSPSGYYSFGNGLHITSWNNLDSSFLNNGWILYNDYIQSGNDLTSLTYSNNFIVNGSIDFLYSVNSFGNIESEFFIYLDGILIHSSKSTLSQYNKFSISILEGYHYIKLIFKNGYIGDSFNDYHGVRINEFTVLGINKALTSPIKCNNGYYTSEKGSTYCNLCGWNTYSNNLSTNCITCPFQEWSLPGSSSCIPMISCTSSDYTLYYNECINGIQTGYYKLSGGIYCIENSIPQNVTMECNHCELGLYRENNSGECKQCDIGYYWNSSINSCMLSEEGKAAILYKSYFLYPMIGNDFPTEFTSNCSGSCIYSNSWIFTPEYATTGISYQENIDLALILTLNIINNGKISFTYINYGDNDNGLQFYINDKQQYIKYYTVFENVVEYPISSGLNTFIWNYHQERNTSGSINLGPIIIEGYGSAIEDIVSPPGYYTLRNSGSNSFIPCPIGTFKSDLNNTCITCESNFIAPTIGSIECIPCTNNTISNNNNSKCIVNMELQMGKKHLYNINSIQESIGPLIIPNSNDYLYINLLEENIYNQTCFNEYNESISSYICKVDKNNNGINIGNYISSIEEVILSDDDNDTGLLFSYSTINSDNECKTSLLITCDYNTDSSLPFFIHEPDKDSCNYELRWDIIFGCYQCTEPTSIIIQHSDCINGEITYQQISVGKCGAYSISDITTTTESCTKNIEISYFVFFIIILAFIIMIICLFSLFIISIGFNINLKSQYSALISNNNNGVYEMEEIKEIGDIIDIEDNNENVNNETEISNENENEAN